MLESIAPGVEICRVPCDAGIIPQQLFDAGFNLRQFYDEEFTLRQMKAAGFTPCQLFDAGIMLAKVQDIVCGTWKVQNSHYGI